MLQGAQSWIFENKPAILSTGVVGGPFEKEGRLTNDFDQFHEDLWMGQDSYEKAQRVLLEDAVQIALRKKAIKEEGIQFFLAGDLINQITTNKFCSPNKSNSTHRIIQCLRRVYSGIGACGDDD